MHWSNLLAEERPNRHICILKIICLYDSKAEVASSFPQQSGRLPGKLPYSLTLNSISAETFSGRCAETHDTPSAGHRKWRSNSHCPEKHMELVATRSHC